MLFVLCHAGGGCAIDQHKEVAQYRSVLSEGMNHAATQPIPVAGEPLTLRAALLLANEHNEQLAIAGEDYLQALIDKDRAAAAFLPTVSLRPTFLWQDKTSSSGGAVAGAGSASKNGRFDVPIVGEANVFNGFRDVANFRRAGLTIEQRRDLLLDFQQSLLLDVVRTYYATLRAERSVEVIRNSLSVQDERLRDVRGRQQAGLARSLDVAQIEAQVAATRVALLQAQRDAKNGRTTLAFLIGAPVDGLELRDDYPLNIDLLPAGNVVATGATSMPSTLPSIIDGDMKTADRLVAYAAASRKDLLAAGAFARATRQDVEIAFGRYYPSVAVNLNYFLSRDSSPTDLRWSGFISADIPIFTAGLIHADVREAWSRFRQATLDEAYLGRQVEQDVRRALEDLLSSEAQILELRVQLEAAEVAFRQSDESYRVGLATNLDRVAAQERLLTTQLQLTSEQLVRKVAFFTLLRVTGVSFAGAEAAREQGKPLWPATQRGTTAQ